MAAIAVAPLLGKMIVPATWRPGQHGMDWRLFVFTFLASLATGILAGLLPALKATRLNVLPLLKNAPRLPKPAIGCAACWSSARWPSRAWC